MMKGNVYGCVSWCLFKILYLYLLPKRITCGHVLHSKKPRWLMYHKSIYPCCIVQTFSLKRNAVSVFDCKHCKMVLNIHSMAWSLVLEINLIGVIVPHGWALIKPRTKLSRRIAAAPGRKSKAIATFVWCWCTGRERAHRSGTQRP